MNQGFHANRTRKLEQTFFGSQIELDVGPRGCESATCAFLVSCLFMFKKCSYFRINPPLSPRMMRANSVEKCIRTECYLAPPSISSCEIAQSLSTFIEVSMFWLEIAELFHPDIFLPGRDYGQSQVSSSHVTSFLQSGDQTRKHLFPSLPTKYVESGL